VSHQAEAREHGGNPVRAGRPVLLLDVDGVVNPYDGGCPPGYAEHDLFPGEEPVRINPDHGRWIIELLGHYDVVWATGWNDEANDRLAPLLGIAPLPVLTMPAGPFRPAGRQAAADRRLRARPPGRLARRPARPGSARLGRPPAVADPAHPGRPGPRPAPRAG
jgi:hypothetical protein